MSTRQKPVEDKYLLAASCHDKYSLRRAASIDSDFVVLSPVKKTASHPGANPVGWQGFQQLCATTALPVYALGGLALSEVRQARQSGAQGVALVTGIWEAGEQALARHL